LNSPPNTLDGARLIQAADFMGWPSDIAAWRRVLSWLHARVDKIPISSLPNLVSLVSVWQNMLADIQNPLSQKFLQTALRWIGEITAKPDSDVEGRERWKALERDQRTALVSRLRKLVLRAGRAYPEYAKSIIGRSSSRPDRSSPSFKEIVEYSLVLSETCADELIDLTRRELIEELPQENFDRERRESRERAARINKIRDKPEKERTDAEKRMLSFPRFIRGAKEYGFDDIGIEQHHRAFFPPTPLDQPFHSLLKTAPSKGLQLIAELSNHATEGWKQVHSINSPKYGTPLPLTIEWPWGAQVFWGDHRTYTWFLGHSSPQPLQSAYLALTHWAHCSIDAGESVDDVIKKVVASHQSWAVLGLAISLALEKSRTSETVLSLLSSQRLWSVDLARHVQQPSLNIPIFSFDPADRMSKPAKDAHDYLRNREFHRRSLRDLIPLFVLNNDAQLSSSAQAALASFPTNLPFAYEEEKEDASYLENLREQAQIHASWGDPANYRAERVANKKDLISIRYEASKQPPDRVQESLKQSQQSLADFNVLQWAATALDNGDIDPAIKPEDAIAHVKERIDDVSLNEIAETATSAAFAQSAIAATAALATRLFPDKCGWAWDVLDQIDSMHDSSDGVYSGTNTFHPKRYLIAALYSDLKNSSGREASAERLIRLTTNSNREISQSALATIGKLYPERPRLVSIGAFVATSLFSVPTSSNYEDGSSKFAQREAHRGAIQRDAINMLNGSDRGYLIPPPPAWILDENNGGMNRGHKVDEPYWRRPDIEFDHTLARAVLPHYPFENWLREDDEKELAFEYLRSLVEWTIERAFPSWQDDRSRSVTELYEWYQSLADLCVRSIPSISAETALERLIVPFINRKDEDALNFASCVVTYTTCRLVMDAETISEGAVQVVVLCSTEVVHRLC
jgi:hypothetical protein